MFDFSKITDAIGGFLSNGQSQLPEGATGVVELLSNAGFDPALLDGLNQDEILALLQQHGIDPSIVDPAQLAELMQGSNFAGNLSELAQSWLENRKG